MNGGNRLYVSEQEKVAIRNVTKIKWQIPEQVEYIVGGYEETQPPAATIAWAGTGDASLRSDRAV